LLKYNIPIYFTEDSPIPELPPPNDYKESECPIYRDADHCRFAIHPEGDINIKDELGEHRFRDFVCPRIKEDGRACEWGYGDLTVSSRV
jgi:hypothetical protein